MIFLEKAKRMDWTIIGILVIFMAMSSAFIYSAIQGQGAGYQGYEIRNLIFYAMGFIAVFVVSFFDYRLLLKAAPFFYLFGVVLLVAVLFFGANLYGATGWFRLPFGFNFQPAELMKLTLIMMIAFMIHRRQGEPLDLWHDCVPICMVTAISFCLVLVQPDLGNAIIYLVILLAMLWIGNVRYRYVLIGTAAVIGCLILFFYLFITYHDQIVSMLKDTRGQHWVARIDTFIDPEAVSKDESYQLKNSMIAIGSGGLTGEGYLQGSWSKQGRVPLTYSDSIFVVIGEEFGFLGASALLLLYFVLLYRMILIAIASDHRGGSYLVIGIVAMYVFQIFENIGMLMGIMPLTGITLPFISYGGSSLLINMLSIGLVQSIKVNQEKAQTFSAS